MASLDRPLELHLQKKTKNKKTPSINKSRKNHCTEMEPQDMRCYQKVTHMCNWIPTGRVKKNETKAVSEKTMAGKFPKMVRQQVTKAHIPTYIHIYLHIRVKLQKAQEKTVLKSEEAL